MNITPIPPITPIRQPVSEPSPLKGRGQGEGLRSPSLPSVYRQSGSDSGSDIETLKARCAADPRIDFFQSLNFAALGGVTLVHRWGAKYFPSLDALTTWLDTAEDNSRNSKLET